MKKRYVLNLTEAERDGLEQVAEDGKKWPEKARRARMLLLADDCLTDAEICEEVGVGRATVERVRKRAASEGIAAALQRKPQSSPSRKPVLDGRAEAELITIACSCPPEGRSRWTLQLLTDRMVELEVVETVSVSTVGRRLKKTSSNPGE
jgi:transposase